MDAHELAHKGWADSRAVQGDLNEATQKAIEGLIEGHGQLSDGFTQLLDRVIALERRVAELETERS